MLCSKGHEAAILSFFDDDDRLVCHSEFDSSW